MLFTVLALKVDPKQITFKTVANKLLVTMNGGQPEDMSKGLSPIVQVTDRQGNVLKQTGGASGGAPIIPSNLPAKPVKVGDTWSNKFHDVGNEFKLVGIKNEKGRQVALIQVAAYSRNGKTVTPGVMRIDLATGMLLNYELKISNGRLTTTSSLQQIK